MELNITNADVIDVLSPSERMLFEKGPTDVLGPVALGNLVVSAVPRVVAKVAKSMGSAGFEVSEITLSLELKGEPGGIGIAGAVEIRLTRP